MRFLGVICLVWGMMVASAHGVEDIDLLTYHDAPPFIVNKARQSGLTYDMAIYLSVASQGRYRFNVKILPRMRLNQTVRRVTNCVVPWVNPAWFKSPRSKGHLWSQSYLRDHNVVVSRRSSPLIFKKEEDLYGKQLAGLYGGKWLGLEGKLQDGVLSRLNSHSYESIIQMVLAGRVSGGILPDSVNSYFLHSDRVLSEKLYVAKNHQSTYDRHFMTCGRDDVAQFLDKMVVVLSTDERWRKLIAHYGLNLSEKKK